MSAVSISIDSSYVPRVAALLQRARWWSARCPAHNDHNNSLSVGEGDDGKVLLHCHAGCSVEEIVDELDLTMHDLFDRRRRRRPLRYRTDEEE